jgi:hypothetical protein
MSKGLLCQWWGCFSLLSDQNLSRTDHIKAKTKNKKQKAALLTHLGSLPNSPTATLQ